MKTLKDLAVITGGEQEYAITAENYPMFLEFANLLLEDSPSFEIDKQTCPGWPYDSMYFEARPDTKFEKPAVDFILNVGIKLRKLED